MAGKPQKNLAYSVLLDFYGPALTEKQHGTQHIDHVLHRRAFAAEYGEREHAADNGHGAQHTGQG